MGLRMSETTVAVEFGKEELSYLIDFLVEDLRVWSEKGFDSGEEKEQFQSIVNVLCKLREAIGESATLFL
jgi:hypothetical protein